MATLLQIDTSLAATVTYFDQLTPLEGTEYLLRFLWSQRESAWYLNFYDQDSNPIAVGLRLNVSVSLLRRFRDARLPPGVLFCADMTGQNLDIQTQGELGARVLLVYQTSV
jgi:hypothetical protein